LLIAVVWSFEVLMHGRWTCVLAIEYMFLRCSGTCGVASNLYLDHRAITLEGTPLFSMTFLVSTRFSPTST